eukprot:GHUV01041790.1.p1 GENE.GHUV01041790.1~~GHUV01041790.1.p1  ORF type:complete len:155 (-),score=64.66 GHUV01041790.1:99-563(-)
MAAADVFLYLWPALLLRQEQQVQQLAADSAAIPELTTQTEEVKEALAAALSSSMLLMQSAEVKRPSSPGKINVRATSAAAASPAVPGSPAYSARGHYGYDQAAAGSPHGYATWVDHQRAPVHCCHGGSSYLLSGLSPAAGMLRTKMDQLDWDIR